LPSLRAHPLEAERLDDLRHRAASLLTGTAATRGSSTRAADALTVLHSLASAAETAPAALTLLHELQVHQVELELQTQELHESREALESALRRQIELYDCHPTGCLTLDHRRVVLEINRAGAEMLGLQRDDVCGLPLDTCLSMDSAHRLGAMVAKLEAGAQGAAGLLRLKAKDGIERSILASFGTDPAGTGYLVSIAHAGDGEDLPPASN
jgi:PAS domain-containing protein